jgi:hypothetical protein
MSWSSAIPVEHDMSGSDNAIEACLSRVRVQAGLDADPVLPPVHVVIGRKEESSPYVRRPSPPPPTFGVTVPVAPPVAAEPEPEVRRVRRTTWPLVFCAFVVGITGGASLMMSPLGNTPTMRHIVKTAKAQIINVANAVP